uniref:beta-fructofuranosidase n=1 Tax=Gentiana triflora TaxID=55190 RepID=A0A090BCM9_GENTR|nr:invertase [Gentiana triflora]
MPSKNSKSPSSDPENAYPYTPLIDQPQPEEFPSGRSRRSIKVLTVSFFSSLLLVSAIFLIFNQVSEPEGKVNVAGGKSLQSESVLPSNLSPAPSRGVSQGVSEKSFRVDPGEDVIFSWTNAMLSWQRTGYHFQPEKNWMNDPDGPLFHKGWYHLFYQYNPDSAVWGNISWGHAVSTDLIHWLHLPISFIPDKWYDSNGVWTGSATILPDGSIVMLYTGSTDDLVQVQNLAYPANLSDPLLLDWVKYPGNPVLVPPPGIGGQDFRDPTTAWAGPDGKKWFITIGSKVNKTGVSLVYETVDFKKYKLWDGFLHEVPGTGMWECVDFYPVSTVEGNGLDTSYNGPGIKHLLKASMDDDKNDYYALGTYDIVKQKWTPDNPEIDVGLGLRYDYGKFYASKTFYDQNKQRRILWGWIGETDSEAIDLFKGWASVQTIPRTVVFDKETGTNILQWPVEEMESLRQGGNEFNNVKLPPGSVVPLDVGSGAQLDIVASFEVDKVALEEATTEEEEADNTSYQCTTSGGASSRGKLGPFGLIVFADASLSELTPVYFYITKGPDGKIQTHFCSDESRSSQAPDVSKEIYGSTVPVLAGEKLSVRILVDHSIVESFAQGGRTVITSRVYPTKAIYTAARLFLFNNATGVTVSASAKIWHLNSADIRSY